VDEGQFSSKFGAGISQESPKLSLGRMMIPDFGASGIPKQKTLKLNTSLE
jgi:hypothetical protein